MDVTIRAARAEEFTAIGELTGRAYLSQDLLLLGEADPYLRVLRDVRHRAAHADLLVAADAGSDTVLGTVTFVGDAGAYADLAGPDEGEFRMLAVRPEARGRGVGEALVRECLARARERGLLRVVLSTQPEMAAAHRLYERLGFRRTPERDWKPIPDLTLWTFATELAPPPG